MSGHTKEYEVRLLHTRTREETVTVHAESPEDARDQIDEMLAVQFIFATGERVKTALVSVNSKEVEE